VAFAVNHSRIQLLLESSKGVRGILRVVDGRLAEGSHHGTEAFDHRRVDLGQARVGVRDHDNRSLTPCLPGFPRIGKMGGNRGLVKRIGNGELCRHPKSMRWQDEENGEVVCKACGTVLEQELMPVAAEATKFGRGPVNNSVFRGNKGATSKVNANQRGPEPCHLDAVSAVHGGHGHLGSLIQTRTCPICQTQQAVKVINDEALLCEKESCGILVCDKCAKHAEISEANGGMRCSIGSSVSEDLVCEKFGDVRKNVKFHRTHLGQYLLRWQPANNNGNGHALSFWADVRLLQKWDPVEDDPNVKAAREILREHLLNKVTPEDGHRIASAYLAAVKKISRIPRSTLAEMLTTLLDSEQVTLEN
jgi:transcription elongation factor Elf1